MVWNRRVSGRLKSDMRISQEITYNNFPFPETDDNSRRKIEDSSRAVIAARLLHPNSSLADLYNPLSMPPALLRAHEDLDRVVDETFAPRKRFTLDEQRLEVLFDAYSRLASPLLARASDKQAGTVI